MEEQKNNTIYNFLLDEKGVAYNTASNHKLEVGMAWEWR